MGKDGADRGEGTCETVREKTLASLRTTEKIWECLDLFYLK